MIRLKNNLSLALLIILACNFAHAQSADTAIKRDFDYISKLKLEVRADFNFEQPILNSHTQGVVNGENTYGFVGRYFNLHMGGNLTKNLSYYFRQRIVANPGSVNFFDNTDFLYLNYNINKNWSLRVGKEALAVGGFEYDAPPIDVLYSSYYWDNFYCFQLAGAVSFHSSDGKNTLTAQVANSPYVFYGSTFKNSLMSYSLFWSGSFGCFSALYSMNMFERERGKFMNYLVLGNKLSFDHFSIYLDLIHHATNTKQLFKNFAAVSRADVKITDGALVFAKAAYEQNLDQLEIAHFNSTGDIWDCLALPGQQYYYYGLGFEFRPQKCRDLRIHGFVANYTMRNDYASELQPVDLKETHRINANVGVTWDIDFVKYFRKR